MARTFTLEQQLPHVDAQEDLKVLSEGLADDHPEVREHCAQRLAALRNPEAATHLRHALDDDSDAVRVWGAYGLGMLRRQKDQDALEKAASDEAPLVRVWAAFGLANLGVPGAVARLVAAFDLPDLELRSNVADALLSLEDTAAARPLLAKRLASADPRKRVWAAAVLHRLGDPAAFPAWRDALVEPQTRVDAALAATHLRAKEAASELVRVTAELTQEELETPVAEANELPLAEVLTSPLLELDLPALAEAAREDAGLRFNLLLLTLRAPTADPEVLGTLYEFAASLGADALGNDVAELLGEQDPAERPELLSRLVDFSPDAVVPTLKACEAADRERLLEQVAAAGATPTDANRGLAPLLELLRETPFARRFEQLPPHPWGEEPQTDFGEEALDEEARLELEALAEEEDLAEVVERMVAGGEVSDEQRARAEAMLQDLGLTADEFVASLAESGFEEPIPPEPEQVALRALALGALQERARLEEEAADKKLDPEAARAAQRALLDWLEGEAISQVLTPLEVDLLEADPGDWLDEDMDLVDASTEALAVLLWALGLGELPGADAEVDPPTVMKKLPLLAATEKFVARARVRDPAEVEPVRELYETFLWRTEQESTARLALAGEEVQAELDLDAIAEELAQDGFDAQKARQKGGEGAVLAEALRFLGRKAAARLAEAGQLTLVKGDFGFEGKPLHQLADEQLPAVLALAQERHRAAGWVLHGGEWDELPLEDDGGEFLEDELDAEGEEPGDPDEVDEDDQG